MNTLLVDIAADRDITKLTIWWYYVGCDPQLKIFALGSVPYSNSYIPQHFFVVFTLGITVNMRRTVKFDSI